VLGAEDPLDVLLRISDGMAAAASWVTDKRQLLVEAGPGDLILAAWPGEYRQDVFVVDNIDEARTALCATR
jgi:hypothetical protein